MTRRTARHVVSLLFAIAMLGFGAVLHAHEVVGIEPETQPFFKWGAASGDKSHGLVQPALATGAAVVPIPIEVPRGANGFQPELTLTYNSRRRHGNAGKGWALELPKIVRSTRYGSDKAQTWSRTEAIYEYDGEELTRGSEQYQDACKRGLGRAYYRRVHRFERIAYCEDDDYWVVIDKDGTIRFFWAVHVTP